MRRNALTVEALPMPSETASIMEVLAKLPLPEYDTLSPEQLRGSACVWDETVLSLATAIDLGERSAGDGTAWFPRACRPCLLREAMTALQTHSGSCEQCVDDHTQCPTGLGLVRAVREARR